MGAAAGASDAPSKPASFDCWEESSAARPKFVSVAPEVVLAVPPIRKDQYTALAAAKAHIRAVTKRKDHVLFMLRLSSKQVRARRGAPRISRLTEWLQQGFTLIELMVVLVIIGVLAALIVPNVLDRADDARVTAARTDINNVIQALKLYKLDNQRYPSADQGLQALLVKPSAGVIPPHWKSYLDKLPNDPWGRPYQYLNPGVRGEIDVMSLGADGQPGGDGKNADIGSWE